MANRDFRDTFGTLSSFELDGETIHYYRLDRLEEQGLGAVSRLPFSIKVLLESVVRNNNGFEVTDEDVTNLAQWSPNPSEIKEMPFKPGRVILQDFTGVPSLVDLAALRSAMQRMSGDPARIQPSIPVDLVIDHSVQVDSFGSMAALQINADIEFERNRERYEFLRWGQGAFKNFRVVPPATGIIHQVNLEYLASGVITQEINGRRVALPDSLVGTDSHTTMINGLGVVGWGVGGIEAEAVMLDQPIYMLIPEVIGFKLIGRLPEGATATDLVLAVTQILRARGVVGKFVEFFGMGLSHLSLPDRATLANMAPEYGATMGFFPVDAETLRYLLQTGRAPEQVQLVEEYTRRQGLFRTDETPDPIFTDVLELDMSTIEPAVAGPKRPQDRIPLSQVKDAFEKALVAPTSERGFALSGDALKAKGTVPVGDNGSKAEVGHGMVVIAAITSCTNTSNPSVMVAAGLLAKKAAERGLHSAPYVKTSLAPGSKVVTAYLKEAGLLPYLEELGFYVVGYGCTTCIGNSGPLPASVSGVIDDKRLVAAAVLSGNRNFEGRINPFVRANYLASPPLVVAYAIAGRIDVDLVNEPIATDADGKAVYLRDIWPTQHEIADAISAAIKPEMYAKQYANVYDGNETWNAIPVTGSEVYAWSDDSTYVQEPPFFIDLPAQPEPLSNIQGARVLVLVGDSVTTDHISPAGSISLNSPAAKYLMEHGVEPKDFNSYGTRRGNDRVMVRGTFANIRLRNQIAPGTEGGVTTYLPTGEQMSIFDASELYQASGTPLLVIAGKEYGTGSSRDWAAKGTFLLGVRAVIAESYERIHRSNLIGMGVLPLQFKPGESWQSLGLTGRETFDILGLDDDLRAGQDVKVRAVAEDGTEKNFVVTCRLDTPVEVNYYRNGGILQTVLRNFLHQEVNA
ncbi:MAG TPA: aconitate hydratase AcnA [Aggregatilinea sp.]|uniref:aconitate hydratase AcnA n=1 Tax=Aggregatilinea sp. TaxID=2806333 RepID=UPI002C0F042E|nr:aconitate hydratase AcnA [Aggregatilinea sp.]HML20139.1 aconitate hydratase AcnA [Aggregatilinea sp.]